MMTIIIIAEDDDDDDEDDDSDNDEKYIANNFRSSFNVVCWLYIFPTNTHTLQYIDTNFIDI